jgi:hypothetical protein
MPPPFEGATAVAQVAEAGPKATAAAPIDVPSVSLSVDTVSPPTVEHKTIAAAAAAPASVPTSFVTESVRRHNQRQIAL